MALVCPVGHPPGNGSFCRLCGRDFVEEQALAPAAELVGAGASYELPVAAPAVGAPSAGPVPPPPPPPAPVPTALLVPPPASPPVMPPSGPPAGAVPSTAFPGNPVPRVDAALPPTAFPGNPVPRADAAPLPAPSVSPEGPSLSFPLVEVPVAEPAEADVEPAAEAESEQEAEAVAVPGGVDRTTVLAGAFAGFLGGLVSGAGISIFLA